MDKEKIYNLIKKFDGREAMNDDDLCAAYFLASMREQGLKIENYCNMPEKVMQERGYNLMLIHQISKNLGLKDTQGLLKNISFWQKIKSAFVAIKIKCQKIKMGNE